jgi:NMD protein affecting ribosome stability and mRNA decay
MSKVKVDPCPKCDSQIVAKATDKTNKHYCSHCRHVWIPGATDKSGIEGQLREAKALIQEQLIMISRLRKEIECLKEGKPALEIFE